MYLPLQITPLRLQEITVLYVLLRLIASDYHFGIFKHFLNLHVIIKVCGHVFVY
jgi:hypothetical protein